MDIARKPDANRFELIHDGTVIGTLAYSYEGDVTSLDHLTIKREFSGQGLAADFTEAVLAHLRDNQEAVIPRCPYVRGYIVKHPQWRDLLPPDVQLSA